MRPRIQPTPYAPVPDWAQHIANRMDGLTPVAKRNLAQLIAEGHGAEVAAKDREIERLRAGVSDLFTLVNEAHVEIRAFRSVICRTLSEHHWWRPFRNARARRILRLYTDSQTT